MENATVQVSTQVENQTQAAVPVTLRLRIFGPDGQAAGSTETQAAVPEQGAFTFNQNLSVAQPKMWSPATPVLYRAVVEVIVAGQVMDSEQSTFGIRTIAWNAADGLLLNGKSIKMKGGCVHHDNGVLGAASFPRAEERKVELLRASGFDAIRCAHNPPAPAFLDACDRLGMLVIDESFDCWREGKNSFDYHLFFDDWWQRDTTSMVLRDRNHPSVIIWSIGNEVLERDGRSNGAEVARMQADWVRKLDPTRPVTAAMNGVRETSGRTWLDTDPVFSTLDIGGYNYQWRVYRDDHARHPERMMMGTETLPLEAYDNWMSVLELPYVVGDFVWTSNDYLGESGIGRVYYEPEMTSFLGPYPWHQAYCGDIDIAGFKRPQSYYRDVLWNNGEKMYIAVHTPIAEGLTEKITRWGWPDVANSWTWPGNEGKTLKVDVYSAFEKVELFVNGRSAGVQTLSPEHKLVASFEVAYEPGELKAVGYTGGAAQGQTALKTAAAAQSIRLTADRTLLQAEPETGLSDLAYVTVEVVDANGCLDPNAMHPIYFTVQGAGAIQAVGSGNPASTERYTGNQRQVFHGRCVVVVKPSGPAGEIRLRAQADGLDGAEIVLQAR
jgi:beta-galactosidase